MDTMMTSKDNTTSADASAPQHHHHHQEEVKEAMLQAQHEAAHIGGERKRPQVHEALRCPRCQSNNTKFCYYNNHSMLQPRYFCKACRRYWTQGGSLRNVPIGGGSRKNKRSSNFSSSSSSSSISKQPHQHQVPTSSTTTEQGFLNMLPTFMPTDFNLPGSHPPFPPPSLSSFVPSSPIPFDDGMPSFLDMLKGGFLDYQHNNFSGATGSGMEHEVVCDHGSPASVDGEGVTGKAHEGETSPAIQKADANEQEVDESVQDTAEEK